MFYAEKGEASAVKTSNSVGQAASRTGCLNLYHHLGRYLEGPKKVALRWICNDPEQPLDGREASEKSLAHPILGI